MNRHLLSYGLDPAAFHSVTEETGAVFSGSGALALYLEQEGRDAGFMPNDMDLWLDGKNGAEAEDRVERLLNFFVRSGYYLARETRERDAYMSHLTRIQRVTTMESQADNGSVTQKKTVQLIVVRTKEGDSVYDYIANQFDLSPCMTWWGPEERRFYTMYPQLTKGKKMFLRRSFLSMINQAREAERIQKYEERGFTMVEEPPPFWEAPDEREEADLAPWQEVQAFDVWKYEDVNAREHLHGGDQKILLGCGGTWQAYDRRELMAYRKEKEQGGLYDTPYRQTVVYHAWELFLYADYSIYHLVDPEVQGDKTVYVMEAYSVQSWCRGEPLIIIGTQSALPIQEDQEQQEQQEDQEQQEQQEELPPLEDLLVGDEEAAEIAAMNEAFASAFASDEIVEEDVGGIDIQTYLMEMGWGIGE